MSFAGKRVGFVVGSTILLGGSWVVSECVDSYSRVYVVSRYILKRQGVNWKAPLAPQSRIDAIGQTAAMVWFAGCTLAFKAAFDRILLSPKPNKAVLFDKLPPQRERLTWTYMWQTLGPHATSASVRQFGRLHGLRVTSALLAAMCGVMTSPYVQARAESLFYARTEPVPWGTSSQAANEVPPVGTAPKAVETGKAA